MTEWIKCEIGDLCNTISETYRGNDEEVILVNTSDVLDGKILNHKRVKNEKLKGQFKKTFLPDDILYSEIRPANRRFAYVDVQDTSLYIASTKLMVLRCNTDIVIPKFLFAMLTSQTMIDELQLRAESRSGTFPQITFGAELAPMKVNIPDKETQLKIVSVLESFQQKLETNNKINRNLTQQAQALYKAWFVDFEPFNGSMPTEWRISTLGEVSIMGAGGDKPKIVSDIKSDECPFPIYSNGIIDEGLYGFTDKPKVSEESVTVSARGTIGFVCLRHVPYVPIVRLVTLIPDTSQITAKYLYHYLNQIDIVGTGTTQQQLTVPDFRKTKIIVPTKEICEKFTAIIDPMYLTIWHNQDENNRLSNLRDTLLPRLMSGELDVSELELE